MPMVRTTHIQQMLMEALELTKAVDGQREGSSVTTEGSRGKPKSLDEALDRAVNLATHAAAEMEDERQRLLGWT